MYNFEVDAVPPEHSSQCDFQWLLPRRRVLCGRAHVLPRYAEESAALCSWAGGVCMNGALCVERSRTLCLARARACASDFSAFFWWPGRR